MAAMVYCNAIKSYSNYNPTNKKKSYRYNIEDKYKHLQTVCLNEMCYGQSILATFLLSENRQLSKFRSDFSDAE